MGWILLSYHNDLGLIMNFRSSHLYLKSLDLISRFVKKYAEMNAVINSIGVMSTFCMWADNGSSTGIFYLEAFDTVFVKKSHEKLTWGGQSNNFMIEKI